MIPAPFFAVWLVISGVPEIVDGDTLRLEGERLRIVGIDAPESRQAGGAEATQELRRLVGGKPVDCGWTGRRDRYKRLLVVCLSAAGEDIGAAMVRAGWARARWGDYYLMEQYEARGARRGLWRN